MSVCLCADRGDNFENVDLEVAAAYAIHKARHLYVIYSCSVINCLGEVVKIFDESEGCEREKIDEYLC